jgi:hypothetical protein
MRVQGSLHVYWRRRMSVALLGLLVVALLGSLAVRPSDVTAIDVAWTQIAAPGPVADVAVSPQGEVWIVLADNRIAKWNGNGFDVVAGQATRIAAGANGLVLSIGTDGNGYRLQNNIWQRFFQIQGAVDIAISANGSIWTTDPAGVERTIDPSLTTGFSNQTTDVVRIAASPDGTPWGVKRDGSIIVPVERAFRTLPGLAQDVGIGANGAVWMTGPDDSIWLFTGTGWDRAPGAARFVSVAPDGVPWVVNGAGNLYRGAPAGQTAPAPAVGPAPFPAPAAVTTRPLIALLCKVADKAEEPRTTTQVQAILMGPGGLNDYIREQSLGAMSLEGTQTFGWFPVASPEASYRGNDGARKMADDCAAAAPQVAFPDNAVVTFFTNAEITPGTTFPWRGTRGGVEREYSAIVLATSGLTGPALVAHELGHVLGMGHQDDGWDPLGGAPLGNAFIVDNPVGPMGPGFNAPHRDRAGWIPAGRKFQYTGTRQQVTLTRLTLPTTGDFLMAQIPIGAGPTFFTVEMRMWAGADGLPWGPFKNTIPGEGVLIHRVDPGQPGQRTPETDTRVVVARAGAAANSDGALWRKGETFTDAASNISIRIDEVDVLRGTAQVTIAPVNAQAAAPPAPAPTTAPPPAMMPPAMMPQPTTVPQMPPAPPATGTAQDNLANAGLITVPAMVGPVSTAAATEEAGEPQPCGTVGKTVWLRFVAPATGTFTAETAGSSFDTILAAYRSPGPAAGFAGLTEAGCNDDTDGRQSRVTFTATAGETVYLQAGGFGGESGDLIVRVVAGGT